jgi:hypothetical protein
MGRQRQKRLEKEEEEDIPVREYDGKRSLGRCSYRWMIL